jgi:hypothetical protein
MTDVRIRNKKTVEEYASAVADFRRGKHVPNDGGGVRSIAR